MTEDRRGWIHRPIACVFLTPDRQHVLVTPGAWDVQVATSDLLAAGLTPLPGDMLSFEVADVSAAGGDNTLYRVALGEIVIYEPQEGERA